MNIPITLAVFFCICLLSAGAIFGLLAFALCHAASADRQREERGYSKRGSKDGAFSRQHSSAQTI